MAIRLRAVVCAGGGGGNNAAAPANVIADMVVVMVVVAVAVGPSDSQRSPPAAACSRRVMELGRLAHVQANSAAAARSSYPRPRCGSRGPLARFRIPTPGPVVRRLLWRGGGRRRRIAAAQVVWAAGPGLEEPRRRSILVIPRSSWHGRRCAVAGGAEPPRCGER